MRVGCIVLVGLYILSRITVVLQYKMLLLVKILGAFGVCGLRIKVDVCAQSFSMARIRMFDIALFNKMKQNIWIINLRK